MYTSLCKRILLGIDSVFSKIGCDSTAITDMLGGHAGVTETTVLQYLGIVEQRTNELLQLQAFLHAKVCIYVNLCIPTYVATYVGICTYLQCTYTQLKQCMRETGIT